MNMGEKTVNSAGYMLWHNYCHLVVVKFEVQLN